MLMLTVVESKITKRLFVFAILLFTSFILIGCDDLGSTIDLYGEYDKITKTCEFNVAYTDNSSFLTDGAGYATLVSLTDGDTTNFRLPEGQNITIRYHGVDTPESTGTVEKWGKAASLFVKSKLEEAKSIVLEATSTPASHDSYGVRYLGYIWYKLGDEDPYKLLNLELVENGFSKNKCIVDLVPVQKLGRFLLHEAAIGAQPVFITPLLQYDCSITYQANDDDEEQCQGIGYR